MKKWVLFFLLFILLLLPAVFAVEQPTPIPRYSDFPLDNIHILRLQDAAKSIASNVSMLEDEIIDFKITQTEQLNAFRKTLEEYNRMHSQQFRSLEEKLTQTQVSPPETVETPQAEKKVPATVYTLLSVNVLILVIVIILIFYLRSEYIKKIKKHESEAPSPDQLIAYVKRNLKKKNLEKVRLDLAEKGWTPSLIEEAIEAAKK